MAPRRGPRPGDDPLVGDARRPRGPGERHDGDRRPPRVPQRHRGQPRRHRRGVRRGRGPIAAGLRDHRPPRARRRPARARRERALHQGRRPGPGGHPRRLHLLGRIPARRRRPGRRPGGRRPRPRLRGDRRRRRAPPAGRPHPRRLAARPLRPPAHGSRAARDDPPQPDVEPEQRRRLRRPGPLQQPGGPRHRRDRGQRPGGVPPGLRPAALGRRHLRAGHGLVVAGDRLEPGARGPRRRGHLVLRPDGPLADRLHPRDHAAPDHDRRRGGPRRRRPTRVDADEIRAKAREQAARLHARL